MQNEDANPRHAVDIFGLIHKMKNLILEFQQMKEEKLFNSYSIKTCTRTRFRFSISNRIKFQRRKMSQKANASPRKDEKGSGSKTIVYCPVCNKDYRIEGALKNHMKKAHGMSAEDSMVFEPSMASTAENFLEGMRDEVAEIEEQNRKRKRESKSSGDIDSCEEDEDEDLESARKAQEARKEKISKLNQERDQVLGLDETMVAGGSNTQEIFANLQEAVRRLSGDNDQDQGSQVQVFDEPSQADNNNSTIDVEKEVGQHDLKVKIKQLEDIIENKDSLILDLQVKSNEMNDQLDAKDRVIKEKRQIIKLKQDEIEFHLKNKEEDAQKLKTSPFKEQVREQIKNQWKDQYVKAEKTMANQAGRIKNLENEVAKLNNANQSLKTKLKEAEKEKPQVQKLKSSAQELIERSEFIKNEKLDLENQVARLKKKIPCPDRAKCELGKKCHYSHDLVYQQIKKEVKRIPCHFYVQGKCHQQEKCGFSHDQALMSAKQRKMFLDNVIKKRNEELEDEYMEEEDDDDQVRGNYSRSAEFNRNRAKRMKTEDRNRSRDSYDTDDTRNFPTPIPAGTRSSYSNSPRDNSRPAGNARGAQVRRSSLVTPKEKYGSQGMRKRGGSLSRSRRTSPPRNREENYPSSSRWDREYNQGRDQRGNPRFRDNFQGKPRRW